MFGEDLRVVPVGILLMLVGVRLALVGRLFILWTIAGMHRVGFGWGFGELGEDS